MNATTDHLTLLLSVQINEITLMLYSKIDENNALQRKVEQLTYQNQQMMFTQQIASLQHAANNGTTASFASATSPVLSAAANCAQNGNSTVATNNATFN